MGIDTHDVPNFASTRPFATAAMLAPSSYHPPYTPPPPASVWAAALEDPHRGAIILDRNLRSVHMSNAARTMLAVPAESAERGLDLRSLLSSGSLDQLSAISAIRLLEQAFAEPSPSPLLLHGTGIESILHMTARSLGAGYALATLEPSGGEAPRPRLQTFEVADPLTGIASRRAFENAVRSALAPERGGAAGVMLLDLDRFKTVNDTLGHGAGDALLRLAAERLMSAVREGDTVARLGGDEFAVLLEAAPSSDQAAGVAKRILELVQRTYLIEDQLVNIGVSIGIAVAPEHGSTSESLMRYADLALYESKRSGGGSFRLFDWSMDLRAQARRRNELELRRALSLRQFDVYYQPQIDISNSNRLVGFEALVRWKHPERGFVPPSEFIPLAEEIGVIVPLGEWVLRTACRHAMTWPSDVSVAVNVSPAQFVTGRFAESVHNVLASTGLPGSRLEIEVTEGLLLRPERVIFETLDALREMKVRIAMDDFGTGYASLSQLAQFHFDKIKIDQSLVGSEGHQTKHRAIVRAIAALGRGLGVSTIAEGVETEEQLERLRQDGCGSVQGYFFGKPVPASQTGGILAQFNPGEK